LLLLKLTCASLLLLILMLLSGSLGHHFLQLLLLRLLWRLRWCVWGMVSVLALLLVCWGGR
jgi:hypothetical protein